MAEQQQDPPNPPSSYEGTTLQKTLWVGATPLQASVSAVGFGLSFGAAIVSVGVSTLAAYYVRNPATKFINYMRPKVFNLLNGLSDATYVTLDSTANAVDGMAQTVTLERAVSTNK